MIIKKLRLDRGWSQEDLAEISGVSVRTIQRIEQGGRASLETLKCLAAVFETPVPELRKAEKMPDQTPEKPDTTAPVELQEPARPAAGMSDEDRAALRYAKNLRKYEEAPENARQTTADGVPADEQQRIRAEVHRMRGFYTQLVRYVVITGFLLVINLLTNPEYIWAVWPALGMGIGLALHGWKVFGGDVLLGEDWERREVMKRLERLECR